MTTFIVYDCLVTLQIIVLNRTYIHILVIVTLKQNAEILLTTYRVFLQGGIVTFRI